MDYSLALMTGADITVPSCQITIHQPSVKEISVIGEEQYLRAGAIFTANKKALSALSANDQVTNFLIFMTFLNDNPEEKRLIQNVAVLLFPQYKLVFTPRAMCFKLDSEIFTINEENFDDLQDVLRLVFCQAKQGEKDFNPEGKRAEEIAKKLMRARQRVAAQKGSEGKGPTIGSYISVLSVGLHLSILEVCNFTLFQVYDLIERYGLYTNWDIDIRAKLAGSTSETKVENWMKSLH